MFQFLKTFFSRQKDDLSVARSSDWPKVRKEHLKTQPFCQACGTIKDLEVHHIEPVHLVPQKELDVNNLITLCGSRCHLLFGHLMDYKSWNTNVVEDTNIFYNKIQKRPRK
jgi:5-methylcytosine-specific restriction endonuclease McrA